MPLNQPSARASTTSVDTSVNASSATQILSNRSQPPFRNRSTPTPKVFNSSGVQLIKSGQTIDQSFFSSVYSSYTNLVNKPLALVLIVLSTFCLLAIDVHSHSPLTLSYNSLLKTAKDVSIPLFVRSIATLFVYILALLIQYELPIVSFLSFSAVYVAKPAVANRFLCIFCVFLTTMGSFTPFEILALFHSVFLFTQIRQPQYKFFICLFVVVCLIFGFSHNASMTSLNSMTPYPGASPPDVTPPTDPEEPEEKPTDPPIDPEEPEENPVDPPPVEEIPSIVVGNPETPIAEQSEEKPSSRLEKLNEESVNLPPTEEVLPVVSEYSEEMSL